MSGIGEKEKQAQNQSAGNAVADGSGQAFLDKQIENLRIAFIFMFPVIAFIAFRAQDILFFLSKKTLEILISPFQIIVWAIIFIYYDVFLIWTAWVLNKKWIIFSTVIIGIASYVPLNFYLVQRYGLAGLSTALVINTAIIFVFIVFSLAKVGIKIPFYKSCEKPAIATMAMTLVLHYMNSAGLALAFISGAFSYALIFLIITFLDN